MTIDLSTIKPKRIILPPRIVLYGPEKIGKSTFGADVPSNLFLDIEGGSGALNVARVEKEKLTNFGSVMATLDALATQDHDFGAVTVDTVDWLEALVFEQVAAENGKRSIEDIGYGKGYEMATNVWRDFFQVLDRLRTEKGMLVILLAHDQVKRYDNPTTESYDRHQLKLHQKSSALLKEWSDCILFANQDVHIDKKDVGFNKKVTKGRAGARILHTVESPAFVAGNRYGLPSELPFSWGAFIDAFNTAVAEPVAGEAGEEPKSEAA